MEVMKVQYSKRPMLVLLLDACGSDHLKIDRLRETLALPQPTEQYFCTYITQEYPLTPAYHNHDYSEWVAVRRPDTPGAMEIGSTLLKIALVTPPEARNTYAFFVLPNGSYEDIVPVSST